MRFFIQFRHCAMYFLPKIHKPGEQMRPIVSNINGPTYNIAKWLIRELNKLPPPYTKSIKNSFDFVTMVKGLKLKDDEMMVSFDVTSLFPSVPVKEALDHVNKWLTTTGLDPIEAKFLLDALSLCMKHNKFVFDGKHYNQSEGTSMGNPVSPWIADAFLGMLELEAEKQNMMPRIWIRYVDDVFAVIKTSEVQPTLSFLNSLYSTINFTVEEEQNNCLNFLDLTIRRNDENTVDIDIYRKPTSTNRYITSESYCPTSQKMAAFQSMTFRLTNLPLSEINYNKELELIKQIAIVNGYKKSSIDKMVDKHKWNIFLRSMSTFFHTPPKDNKKYMQMPYCPEITNKIRNIVNKHNFELAYSSSSKLRNFLPNGKDKITDPFKKSGIYEISCNDCSKVYVGQTRRSLQERYSQHMSKLKNNDLDQSAVALHLFNENHSTKKDNMKLLKEVSSYRKLNAYETFYINKNRTQLMNIKNPPIENMIQGRT